MLVADPSPALRLGVRLALERDGCVVCAEADDVSAAVEGAVHEGPDVCLVDADLPGGGLAAVAEISSRLPRARVIVFSSSRNDADPIPALQAGASGFLFKDIDLARLSMALRSAVDGEPALPRALVTSLIAELRRSERRRQLANSCNLTRRELEVLELLGEGLTTAEVAGRLVVAKVTVRTHIASLLKKLGVADRESAVRLVAQR